MSTPIPVRDLDTPAGVHDENLAPGAPLGADLLTELAAMEGGLMEFLTDQAVPGNETPTVAGHRHGRQEGDGVFLPRHGLVFPGFIAPQSTTDDRFVTVCFTRLNDTGPDADGEEQDATALTLSRAALYLHQDYTTLVFPVLLKAAASTTAIARLSLVDGETVLSQDTQQSGAYQWTPVWFALPISDDAAFTGWRHLVLELRSQQAGQTAHIAGADERFKPMPGVICNGAGYLLGETP